jgi:hypothetical protein
MVKVGTAGGKADQRAARKARLASALRENLKRRKQQARARMPTSEKKPSEPSTAQSAKEPNQR